MSLITLGGIKYNSKMDVPKPRIKLGNGTYLELHTDTTLAPSRPRLKFKIDGIIRYIRELYYRDITRDNITYGNTANGLYSVWSVPGKCKKVSWDIRATFWNIERKNAYIESHVIINGGTVNGGTEFYLGTVQFNETQTHSYSYTSPNSGDNIEVKLKIFKGDPKGTNSNNDSLIHNVWVTNFLATVLY